MNDFFKTLLKVNPANIMKAVVGLAAGVLTVAATIALPPTVVAIASGVVTLGTVLGIHAAHTAEPPKPPLGS